MTEQSNKMTNRAEIFFMAKKGEIINKHESGHKPREIAFSSHRICGNLKPNNPNFLDKLHHSS